MNNYQDKTNLSHSKGKEQLIQILKNSIPTQIKRGHSLIFEERYLDWEKYVMGSVDDFSRSMEIECALKYMQALEDGVSIKDVARIFTMENRGISVAIIGSIVLNFSKKGPEFIEALTNGVFSNEDKKIIKLKKKENKKFDKEQNKIQRLKYNKK